MFKFWYRFVLPEQSRINAGLGETACREVFDGQLSSHMGNAFEEVAKQYMWNILCIRSPIHLMKIIKNRIQR